MNPIARTTLFISGAMVLALTLTGCMSAEEQRQTILHEDGGV